jgi:hypothetical protein
VIKRISILTIAVFFMAGFSFAQEQDQTLIFSGEIKTGLYWEKNVIDGYQTDDQQWIDQQEFAKMHNNDDAGIHEGRFRLNMHAINHDLNMGMKVRFQQTQWIAGSAMSFEFAFAYINFLDDQMKITVGKIGESPWSAGGPDIWNELDNQVGIRTEIMPNVVPGLNVGFVLNNYNNAVYLYDKDTLVDILKESVLGAAYTNDYFHGRFSYRLDGDADVYGANEGMEMMYRLEERALKNYIPGFQIFANGYWRGIEATDTTITNYQNWLYINYNPDAFSSQIRLGLITSTDIAIFRARASFYYNIFPFLSAGTAVKYEQEYGENRTIADKTFKVVGIEPQIRFNINSNAYVALVYAYDWQYVKEGVASDLYLQHRQWLNLRTVLYF